MATLLPSLSSDEEKDTHDDSEEEEIDDINQDFVFGGILVRERRYDGNQIFE